MFDLDTFDGFRDTLKLLHMELSPESRLELVYGGQEPTPKGVYDCILLSQQTWVFTGLKTQRILGVAGLSKPPLEGNIMVPWYLSSGFETQCPIKFYRAAKGLLNYWETQYFNSTLMNVCLNKPRVTKFLTSLGFTVEKSTREFTKFYKKIGGP